MSDLRKCRISHNLSPFKMMSLRIVFDRYIIPATSAGNEQVTVDHNHCSIRFEVINNLN